MTRGEIISLIGIIVSIIIPLLSRKAIRQRIINLPKSLKILGIKLIYSINKCECLYCPTVYFGVSKQANEKAYVYVMKKRNLLRDIRWKFSHKSNVDPKKLGVFQTLAVYRVGRGKKPDWVDDRFLVLEELLPDSIPLFTWEGCHKWYSGGTSYKDKPMLLGFRFQIPIWKNYSDKSGNPKDPDWHEEVIRLSTYPSTLPSNIQSELRDFKRKHKIDFKCYQDFDKPWKCVVKWEIGEKTENQETE